MPGQHAKKSNGFTDILFIKENNLIETLQIASCCH